MADMEIDAARQTLIRRVLGARTRTEITSARLALREWMKVHPDEQGMRDGFEQLAQMEEIAELEGRRAVARQSRSLVSDSRDRQMKQRSATERAARWGMEGRVEIEQARRRPSQSATSRRRALVYSAVVRPQPGQRLTGTPHARSDPS
jgi:hypothetical protein